MKDNYTKNLEDLVKQIIKPLKNIPLNLIIESIYNKKILPFDKNTKANQNLLKLLIKVAENTGNLINQNGGISSNRPNEVGNYIEPFVKRSLENLGYEIKNKNTKSGKSRTVGYPDLEFKDDLGRLCYLECKTFNLKNIATTQRSFYLSPSGDPKINSDGFHFLLSFEVLQEDRSKKYCCISYKILSIENLSCDLKQEFNSDNKRLYSKELILIQGKF